MPNHPSAAISPLRVDHVAADGVVAIEPLSVPFSCFASAEARHTFLSGLQPPPPDIANDVHALREYFGAFNDRLCERMVAAFEVTIEETSIAGVRVQRVSPPPTRNEDERLLLNLHGGAFMWGSGSGALVEAIPVAAVSGLPVIAIDYRLAPEHRFPAASDDVQRVYEELLSTTSSGAIGIYGCSAGAILTAQSIAQFVRQQLPLPGAIAMLGGTGLVPAGDSGCTAAAMCGEPSAFAPEGEMPVSALLPYFDGIRLDDPRVMPGEDHELLSRFPPSMLVGGSRDFTLSSMTTMHRRLVAEGVAAELFVFDGLWHAFHIFADLPESREVYRLLSSFFHKTLKNNQGTGR